MKTAKAHRKFAIYSIYLDTWLEGEEEIADGETRKDTLKRILKDLEETAAELRKEAGDTLISVPQTATPGAKPNGMFVYHQPPIIDKEVERLEILIDNAETLDQLTGLKEEAGKAGLINQYMTKVKEIMGLIANQTFKRDPQ